LSRSRKEYTQQRRTMPLHRWSPFMFSHTLLPYAITHLGTHPFDAYLLFRTLLASWPRSGMLVVDTFRAMRTTQHKQPPFAQPAALSLPTYELVQRRILEHLSAPNQSQSRPSAEEGGVYH